MVPIERGIPMPPRGGHRGERQFPWDEMQIGDSFVFPTSASNETNQASHASQRLNRVFRVRKMPDGSHRCWRTA